MLKDKNSSIENKLTLTILVKSLEASLRVASCCDGVPCFGNTTFKLFSNKLLLAGGTGDSTPDVLSLFLLDKIGAGELVSKLPYAGGGGSLKRRADVRC